MMLAHELCNPLDPIVNAIHLLANPRVQCQSVDQPHEMLRRQVRYLSRLVDDLLDVSGITRGKVQLRREPVDIAQLVCAAAEDHRLLELLEQVGTPAARQVLADVAQARAGTPLAREVAAALERLRRRPDPVP